MCTNKHYYCMFNGITVTTSDIIDEEYKEYICVRFERPNNNNGFDFAEIIMPDKKFIKSFGFSEDELYWIESFAADNLLLMWEMAKESKQLPKILAGFLWYVFYFWANENMEPIHVHVAKGTQTLNATKFWITSDGAELANNNGKIPDNELRQIRKYILLNRERIIAQWISVFGEGKVKK